MLDGVNLDGGTCLGDAVKKRANETAGHFSGLMLTTGFRPKRYVRFWPHLVRKYPFYFLKALEQPQKESKYLQQAQSWERVLHTGPGVGKAEITFKRLGFETSAGAEKTQQNSGAKRRFVCVGG